MLTLVAFGYCTSEGFHSSQRTCTAAHVRGLPQEGQNMRWRATNRSITPLKISLHKSNIEQQHRPILCQPPA